MIRIKPYFCPKCQSFKRWYGVTATDEFLIYHYCKSCGTQCYDTEVLLETMISARASAFYVSENMKGEDDAEVR